MARHCRMGQLRRVVLRFAMHTTLVKILILLFSVVGFSCATPSSNEIHMFLDQKFLNVGQELWRESLPLQMGSRLYQLQGLKSLRWYEVKISYPASVPSSFSIQLKRGKSEFRHNQNRRLLNTEKLIFSSNDFDRDDMYVMVSVEPEGIVAIPQLKEREFVIFNIVCEELLLGIPHRAYWIGIVAFLCLGLAFIVPFLLPPSLLRRDHHRMRPADHILSKDT